MPSWSIIDSEGLEKFVEADSVSLAGTVVCFLKHSKIETAEGKVQGIPVAFANLANPKLFLIEMVEDPEGAKVLSIV